MINNRVVILGSNGFIGSNLKKYLISKNIRTIGLNRSKIDFLKPKSFKKLSKIIKNNDILVNAIAIAPCKTYLDFQKNIEIINNIQKALIGKSLRKYINVSSDAVYPDLMKRLDETIVANPTSVHGLMHLNREKIINFTTSCKILHVRPTLIYGFGDPHGGYGPNLFYKTMIINNFIKIFGNGEEIRDHIHIEDVIYFLTKLIFNKRTGIVNLVSGKGINFLKIALEFKKIQKDLKIIKIKRKQKMPHNGYRLFNNKKLKKLFPKFKFNSFEKNLKIMINNYNEKN